MNAEEKLFTTFLSVDEIDKADVNRARDIFNEYKNNGVIINESFDNDVWKMTDEYENVGIYYDVSEFEYRRFYEHILEIPYSEIRTYLKVFVAFIMGKTALKSIQTIINDIKRILTTDPEEIYAENASLVITSPSQVEDFFSILPNESDELNRLIDALDFYIAVSFSNNVSEKRSLAQFDSYLLFHDILCDFWANEIDDEMRMFYFPLYLWWHITGIIPLRPREFILTERNCIEKREDGYYLTLRRNRLKGGKKSVTYKLKYDYSTDTYKIPDRLADEIIKYYKMTERYRPTNINTLFIQDTHYKRWGQKRHKNSRYLTYINMNTIMRYFFRDVVAERYHLDILYERNSGHLESGTIEYIHLGDTRHLALINAIAEGATPVIAMQLASHDSIEMSAHYYSNLTNLIECRTYRQYRLVTKGNVSYEISNAMKFPIKSTCIELKSGGKCYSEKYQNGNYEDCMETSGNNGELGYCPDCKYYRNKGNEYYRSDDIYKKKIEDDCKLLSDAVRLYRQSKGEPEEIGEIIGRLKTSSFSYQQYCNEKYSLGGTKTNGKKELHNE